MATIFGALVGNTLAIDDVSGTIDSFAVPIDLMLADQATFYTAEVSQGLSISGALVTNNQTFYTATVSASYDISAALYVNTGAFYAATIAPGAVTVAGALFEGSTAFYSAVVTVPGGEQFVTGALAANDNQFFGATVSDASQPSRPRGWDDAGSRYRRPRRPIYIYEDEPEAPPEAVRVKVTRKAVKQAMESAGPVVWPLSVAEAVKVLPQYVPVMPELGQPDTSEITAAIVKRLKAEFVRRAMEADEEDVEMLLLAAA
jgi:hypothetical protein